MESFKETNALTCCPVIRTILGEIVSIVGEIMNTAAHLVTQFLLKLFFGFRPNFVPDQKGPTAGKWD